MTSFRRYLAVLIFASAALFFLDKTFVFAFVSDRVNYKIVRPVVGAGNAVYDGSVSLFESFFLIRQFSEDYSNLAHSRDFYRGEYFKVRSLEEENNFLRGAIGLEGKGGSQLILANVVSADPLRPSSEITIDKGAGDGVIVGQPVILAGQIIVGRVHRVQEKTSNILLVTSQDSRITSTLEGSGTSAIVAGSASGALIMELVLKDVDARRGEIVLTSGIERDIPRNLLVGEVSKVVQEESASFKEVVVRPFFNFNDLRQVFIVRYLNQ